MMMGYWYGGLGWIGVIINLLVSVAAITGLVFLIIWIVKQLSSGNSGMKINYAAPSAVEIAKERYARGEITREEFQKLLEDLGAK
jgi:putative membrane protein